MVGTLLACLNLHCVLLLSNLEGTLCNEFVYRVWTRFLPTVHQHLRVVVARVAVGRGHPVDQARHGQPGFECQLVRCALSIRGRPCLAARREQDRLSQRLQDEDLHHPGCPSHALRRLHLVLEQSVLQVIGATVSFNDILRHISIEDLEITP